MIKINENNSQLNCQGDECDHVCTILCTYGSNYADHRKNNNNL